MPNYINLNQREIELLELYASTKHGQFIQQSFTNIEPSLEMWRLQAVGYIELEIRGDDNMTLVRMTEDGYKFLNDRAMVKPEPEDDKYWLVEYTEWHHGTRTLDSKSHLVLASDELTAAILFFKEHEEAIKAHCVHVQKVNGDYPAHPFWIKE